MRTRSGRLAFALLGGLAAAALAGCSQISALAPVGGDHLATVRYAAIDVLLEAQVEILTAPVCESATDGASTCTGETVDGEAITVNSTAADPTSLAVQVGTKVLYSGSIQDVLDDAARVAS